ncbi:hypothetical protein PInf_012289 [Phytophthora infestans]|nr:hypothetical protein PInf_012289 [Phytophthora infestans]
MAFCVAGSDEDYVDASLVTGEDIANEDADMEGLENETCDDARKFDTLPGGKDTGVAAGEKDVATGEKDVAAGEKDDAASVAAGEKDDAARDKTVAADTKATAAEPGDNNAKSQTEATVRAVQPQILQQCL